MLVLQDVIFRWPQASENCLHTLSLTFPTAEWAALTGQNGAGKSTLLRVMAGLLVPSSGRVLLQNTPLATLNALQRARQIGILFQEAENQFLHSDVFAEVAFGLRLQKRAEDDVLQRTTDALALCGLSDVAHAHPLDLHVAQRRMVAVASLEAMAPPVLLLDEPSRDFDAHWLGMFEGWLAVCRARGATVMAISHDYAFIRRHFSRVLQLENGQIIRDGPAEHVLPVE